MTEKIGIKETKEALIGINEFSLLLAKLFKDGAQFTDFAELFSELTSNEDLKAKMKAAWEDIQKIPAEIKDIDLAEGAELGIIQIGYVPKFIEALKK